MASLFYHPGTVSLNSAAIATDDDTRLMWQRNAPVPAMNYNGDGTFASTATRNSYSPLDLYLMGIIPKEQVPPMLLIDNQAIDKTKMPNLGDTAQ